MSFADHFSSQASQYAAFRPGYPDALFTWLAAQLPTGSTGSTGWDVGCGSGQAAVPLSTVLETVVASDPSVAQLGHAVRRARVHYAAMTAERSALGDQSVQLVTVAQALHWFDRDAFYAEVRRVCAPGGVLAVWSYALFEIDGVHGAPDLNRRVRDFYTNTVGAYWPPERRLVEAGYESLPFPFVELTPPAMAMRVEWTLEQLAGYLGSWSAVARYRAALGDDPVRPFAAALETEWGGAGRQRTISWPLSVRAGRLS